jgi:hypothetical protein
VLSAGFGAGCSARSADCEHGPDPSTYFARWRLPPGRPITAPNYSAQRSSIAKELGLGRRRFGTPRRRSGSRTQEASLGSGEEELADWRAGRNAVYQLAALAIGARLWLRTGND